MSPPIVFFLVLFQGPWSPGRQDRGRHSRAAGPGLQEHHAGELGSFRTGGRSQPRVLPSGASSLVLERERVCQSLVCVFVLCIWYVVFKHPFVSSMG